ncbi:MAG: PA2779 family protein [Gammaproteobacteria bacterium]|nr:PA2779 family protein [Gammaproteobacteria bacterium]
MNMSKAITRATAKVLLLMFVSISGFIPMTQAAMIGTPQIMDQARAQQDRAQLASLLQRDDLVAQLEQAGVDPQQLQARIATLTDQEVATLTEQLNQLPAGSGILGTAVFIFLVLLATDILGFTDVFPFVKKTIN